MATTNNVASVTVNYTETGKDGKTYKVHKDVKFNGKFGFTINGQSYHVSNGKVLNSKGQPISAFNMPRGTAYQFIGMSNTSLEDGRDYTYTEADLKAAKEYCETNSTFSGISAANYHAQMTIGNGAGKIRKTTFSEGVYTTEYKHKDDRRTSTVSVWLSK